MSIAVTAATGQLGRLVVAELIERTSPEQVVAIVRDADKAAGLADAGVDVRVADYDDPAALEAAFAGVERALLISGVDFGKRVQQHQNVAQAAAAAGVQLLAYTSVVKATEAALNPVAEEHAATERMLADVPIDTVMLRNAWYTENYAPTAQAAAATGTHLTSAGDALTASATRADLARAAAAVLTSDGHAGKVYELGADPAWTQSELAAAMAAATGAEISVTQLSADEHRDALIAAGVPEMWAGFSVASDQAARAGETGVVTGDLERLLGGPATSLSDGIAAALADYR